MTDEEKAVILNAITGKHVSKAVKLPATNVTPLTVSPFELSQIPTNTAPPSPNAHTSSNGIHHKLGAAPASDWWESTKAGLRGAADSLPFGVADRALALGHAVIDAGRGQNFGKAYDRRLEAEHAQDRYDEAQHYVARTVGKVAGDVAQMVVPGMGVVKAARLAKATPRLWTEGAKLAALGGGANMAVEGITNAIEGKTPTVAGLVGSGIGGAAGVALALRGKTGAVGSATGGVTSLTQDIIDGKITSAESAREAVLRALDAGAAGGLISGGVGRGGAAISNKLSTKTKGDLGEWLSMQRTRLRGDGVPAPQQKVDLSEGYTIADHVTRSGQAVEAKFGNSAKLRPRQNQAYRELGPDYRVDAFMPNDIGAGTDFLAGLLSRAGYGLAQPAQSLPGKGSRQ